MPSLTRRPANESRSPRIRLSVGLGPQFMPACQCCTMPGMALSHFAQYVAAIRALSLSDLTAPEPPASLLMERDGPLSVYYAPFDLLNQDARLVLVGITPGRTQMNTALRSARESLGGGLPEHEVIRRAKQTASFSGTMRGNLVAMLDYFRIHEVLGIGSCADLFASSAHLVH